MSNLGLVLREKLHALPAFIPTTLSVSRIIASPILWSSLHRESPMVLPLYLMACATDLLDGKIARFLSSSSYDGAVLDASADFLLVATGFTYYVSLGLVSPLLLVAMTLSFLNYVFTVRAPVRSFLGKNVGTILFAMLATLMLFPSERIGIAVSFVGVAYISVSLIIRLLRLHSYRAR